MTLGPLSSATRHLSGAEGRLSGGVLLCDGKTSGRTKGSEENKSCVPVAFENLQVVTRALLFMCQPRATTEEV